MYCKIGIAVIFVALAASQAATQDVAVGARVRITTRLGFRYQGRLTALDSTSVTVTPDDSTPVTPVLRSDIKKFEKSLGMEQVTDYPGWAQAATWIAGTGGAWFGAAGWGHHARPRGVVGGVLGFFAFGVGAAYLLEGYGHDAEEEQWKKVDLTSAVQPVVTSDATGRLFVGVSFSFR